MLVLAGLTCAQEPPERILQEAVTAHRSGNLDAAIRGYRAYLKVRPEAIDARSNWERRWPARAGIPKP